MKIKSLSTIAFLAFTASSLFAQPIVEWEKSLGGSDTDMGYSIQQTSDNGYILAGLTYSSDGDVTTNVGAPSIWIVKLDGAGSIDWENTYGDGNGNFPYHVQQTNDGGYVVAGTSSNANGGYWILKLDGSGGQTWDVSLGGSGIDIPHSIQQTTDGGYIVAGYSTSTNGMVTGNHGGSDYWVAKLNTSGNPVWAKCLGGSGDEEAESIQQTTDGGYIVLGFTDSNDGDVTGNHGGRDMWAVKLDSAGSITWQKCYGGSDEDDVWSNGMAIQQTTDGGYIMASNTFSTDGDVTDNDGILDGWVVKTDSLGNIEWDKTLGGSSGEDFRTIQQTFDGAYIVGGYTQSSDGDVSSYSGGISDYWIVRLNSLGEMEWEKTLGGSDFDDLNSIQRTTDGGLIGLGHTLSNDGDITSGQGGTDYWVVKLGNIQNIPENEISNLSVYPNPTSESITISSEDLILNSRYKIISQTGQVILEGEITSLIMSLNLEFIEKGIYTLELEGEKKTFVRIIKI